MLSTPKPSSHHCLLHIVLYQPFFSLRQGVGLDDLLAKISASKAEVRKIMLLRYMHALDDSGGLQNLTTRLSERLGIGGAPLSSCNMWHPCTMVPD